MSLLLIIPALVLTYCYTLIAYASLRLTLTISLLTMLMWYAHKLGTEIRHMYTSLLNTPKNPLLRTRATTKDWCYTTNHKKLGFLYFMFAGTSALFGTTLASAMRIELAQPGSQLFNNNAGSYHITVAVHAILMVFFVVTPVVFGGFGNYFLPTQVGARDVAYPRLNNFSVWVLPAGLMATLRALWDGIAINLAATAYDAQQLPHYWQRNSWWVLPEVLARIKPPKVAWNTATSATEATSFVAARKPHALDAELTVADVMTTMPTVRPAPHVTMTMAGWTYTTPFSQSRYTGRAVDITLLGLIMATITSIFTTVNLVTTWRFLRGRGARHQRELFPMFLIALFMSLRLLLLVSPILTAGFVMLLADRHFFTAFFTVRAGGDVLLFQHIFWFFGHPEVYMLVIPGFGYTSTVLPYYVKKPMSSKMHMVYAMHSIGCMSMVVWGHHMYLVGIDAKARTVFMTITVMIALPSTIKMCGWMVSLANGLTFPTLDLWLAVMFVSIFFIGGMSGLMVAGAGLDILLHDTYYVVGHFHVMLSGAMILSVFGWLYFNFREIFGTSYAWLFSGLHLSCHVVGHLVCFVPLMWVGYAGMPRRIQDYPYAYSGWHSVASFGHIIVLFGLLNYFMLLAHAAFFKRPLKPRGHGLPFVATRVMTLALDKYFSAAASTSAQTTGIKAIREYVFTRD